MKRIYTYLVIAAAACLFAASCAKEVTTDSKKELRDYFLAWMAANHPGVEPQSNGIYLLEESTGVGLPYTGEEYFYAEITVADIKGNISSTYSEALSKQLGTYNKAYYYGPKMAGLGTMNAGLYNIVYGMQRGGTRKAIIPFWMATYDMYDTQEEYFKNASTSSSNAMYTVKLVDYTTDVDKWEIDSLETHLYKLYKAAPDSVSYGLYYYQTTPPTSDAEFPSDTTIYINYTGKLLNGQVFDTTIENVAKDNNIYSSSKTYKPVKVEWSSDASSITLSGSSVIAGFYNTLYKMKEFEKGVCYFISAKGYSSSGSGSTIPPYSPLCFEIEIVEQP